MISRYAVWLNDIALTEVDPDILITDIGYQAVRQELNTERLAARAGLYTGSGQPYYPETVVAVAFQLRKYHTVDRQAVTQDIIRWALNGGWLKTSDRPGQKIYVQCSRFPTINSVLRWTDSLAIEFTAYDFPFWVDEAAQSIILSDSDTSGKIYLPGSFSTGVELTIEARSALTRVNIGVGETALNLANLSVSAGDVITVGYSARHHLLEIQQGTTSILDKRTADSDDELIAVPGSNTVEFTADGTAVCTVSVRGCYA